ncbi:MAG: phosphoribosylanthranilate isomerase [Rhizobiales bacterium]|nr:phosphoribosylanthranilate isomerase [Hyphomicrobiales bacterium]
MVEVKICGLSEPETLGAALDAGADYVGFMFYEPSPRNIDFATARALSRQVGSRAKKVAVMVDADDEKITQIMQSIEPDYIQAHGSETPDRIKALNEMTGVPIIKAIKVRDANDIASAEQYANAAALVLFDAKAPETLENALPGGNGITFDWGLMGGETKRPRFMLSGGLHKDNLREAIGITKAPIIDVSSAVESSPGVKDIKLIRAFMDAARQA